MYRILLEIYRINIILYSILSVIDNVIKRKNAFVFSTVLFIKVCIYSLYLVECGTLHSVTKFVKFDDSYQCNNLYISKIMYNNETRVFNYCGLIYSLVLLYY